jgi:hypothetical protein
MNGHYSTVGACSEELASYFACKYFGLLGCPLSIWNFLFPITKRGIGFVQTS